MCMTLGMFEVRRRHGSLDEEEFRAVHESPGEIADAFVAEVFDHGDAEVELFLAGETVEEGEEDSADLVIGSIEFFVMGDHLGRDTGKLLRHLT